MPSPRVLKALGMTPAQWGALPPEPGTIGVYQVSDIRVRLRAKAREILAREDELARAREILAREDQVEWAHKVIAEAEREPKKEQGPLTPYAEAEQVQEAIKKRQEELKAEAARIERELRGLGSGGA